MSVLEPDLVFFRDGDVFCFLLGCAFVDFDAVGYFVAVLDGEEVVGHGLVGEFVDERRDEVEAAVEDVKRAASSVGGRWEVVVEFGVEI